MSDSHQSAEFESVVEGISPRRGRRRLSAEERRVLASRRRAGTPIKQLATEYGLHRSSINDILRAEGVEAQRALLGPEHRDELARLYAQGLSIAKIARRYGMNDDTMWRTFKRLGIERRGAHERL